MNQSDSRGTSAIFFWIGLIIICMGILISLDLLKQLASFSGVALNLGGIDGLARTWGLKISFILIGLPPLLYNFRAKTGIRLLFDLSIGLLFTLVILLVIEGIFFRLNDARAVKNPKTALTYSEHYVDVDDRLGYRLKPNLTVSARQTVDDKLIYDVTYSIDENGRRLTPVDSLDNRTKFILFFGGSFTFGDGVEDDETLPAQIGQLAPDFRPYNFGVSGYGTQQLLINLQQADITEEVTEREGIAIYNFICHHVNRVVGTVRVQRFQGDFLPYYTFDANNQLIRQGTLASGRPVLSTIYKVLGLSQVLSYYDVEFPRINSNHFVLTTRIITEAAQVFKQKFNSDEFYVLIHPGTGCASDFTPYLEEAGIKYLDYSTLFSVTEEGLWIPDGHPKAQAIRLLAERLVSDLKIGGGL